MDFSALPNVSLTQEEIDPVVLTMKASEPASASPTPAPSPKPEPTLSAQTEGAADSGKDPDRKKQKKGFGSRIKGFFGSIFGH
jgi:hypothetical protein